MQTAYTHLYVYTEITYMFFLVLLLPKLLLVISVGSRANFLPLNPSSESVALLWCLSFLTNTGIVYSVLWQWFPYYVPFYIPIEITHTHSPF